jgi:hypothetical protein
MQRYIFGRNVVRGELYDKDNENLSNDKYTEKGVRMLRVKCRG